MKEIGSWIGIRLKFNQSKIGFGFASSSSLQVFFYLIWIWLEVNPVLNPRLFSSTSPSWKSSKLCFFPLPAYFCLFNHQVHLLCLPLNVSAQSNQFKVGPGFACYLFCATAMSATTTSTTEARFIPLAGLLAQHFSPKIVNICQTDKSKPFFNSETRISRSSFFLFVGSEAVIGKNSKPVAFFRDCSRRKRNWLDPSLQLSKLNLLKTT